jgi:hypothetical protein
VKDLAPLTYSRPQSWVDRYWDRFLDSYFAGAAAAEDRSVWQQAIDGKVAEMQSRTARREARQEAE